MLIAVLALSVLALVAYVAPSILFPFVFDLDKRHSKDAASFYEKAVKPYLVLPNEADFIDITERRGMYGSERFVVTFRLPPTKSPARWVSSIWADNKYAANSKETMFRYSAEHSIDMIQKKYRSKRWRFSRYHDGFRMVEYLPETGNYRAEINND